MKTINLLLVTLACTATCFADVANGNGQPPTGQVPDSSSTALLLGIALVSSLLVGRKLIKK